MKIWPVAGGLFGAMMGLFAAKEFTDRDLVHILAAFVGACLGIVLSVLISSRHRE